MMGIPGTGLANPVAVVQSGRASCRFIAESVALDIGDTLLAVTGRYKFRALRPRAFESLDFPFLADSTMGDPILLDATIQYDAKPEEPLRVRERGRLWSWNLDHASWDSCEVRLRYSQRLTARHAGYLLTSCRSWREPLEYARLVVRFSPQAEAPRFNLPLSAVWSHRMAPTFQGEFSGWMPTDDLVVSW